MQLVYGLRAQTEVYAHEVRAFASAKPHVLPLSALPAADCMQMNEMDNGKRHQPKSHNC
jgi:hypothetical protein